MRLTRLGSLPWPHPRRVAAHQYRVVGGRVLMADARGRFAWLSPAQYRSYLRGLEDSHPLRARLKQEGWPPPRHADPGAATPGEAGLLSWPGPGTHVLSLEGPGKTMSPETARQVVDFAFSTPGPLVLEMVADGLSESWPAAWFIVEYAALRAEWAKRALSLVLRSSRGLDAERLEFLRGRGVVLRLAVTLAGSPPPQPPVLSGQRALCRVEGSARDAAAWVEWLAQAGFKSLRLDPSPALMSRQGLRLFLGFYERALDRLLSLQACGNLREEWAEALLKRRPWSLPGTDVLSELAYDPTGGVYTSEAALALGEERSELFRLGAAARLRYQDLPGREAVVAALASSQADNQPLCCQCVYQAFCALPASQNYAAQATVWGQTPSSLPCRLRMGILDRVFARLSAGEMRAWAS